jgi:hypothetical protein
MVYQNEKSAGYPISTKKGETFDTEHQLILDGQQVFNAFNIKIGAR